MIAVVTLVTEGRLTHLARQREALDRWAPEVAHVVVVMDQTALDLPHAIHVDGTDRLPLARARNAGAAYALQLGASVLIFLDVDCIPGPALVAKYAEAVRAHDALTCGAVTYLPPAPVGGHHLDELVPAPHPARPALPGGVVAAATDDEYRLFWSLSFAVSPRRWRQIGGFYEGYAGYGGEDTDFGFTARAAGVPMLWIGGADAFHQHHPVSDPPWEHLEDIVVNARLFHQRWSIWPMEGWLREFASAGAITWSADQIELVRDR